MLDIAAYIVYAAILIYAAIIDWRTLRIPNKLVIAIMLDWLVWQILRDVLPRFLLPIGQPNLLIVQEAPAASAASGALAAVILGAGLTLFALAYEVVTHRYAMGGGDVKLMAASALFLGLTRSLLALMVACVAAVVIALIYSRISASVAAVADSAPNASAEVSHGFPFGPAIALGSLSAIFL